MFRSKFLSIFLSRSVSTYVKHTILIYLTITLTIVLIVDLISATSRADLKFKKKIKINKLNYEISFTSDRPGPCTVQLYFHFKKYFEKKRILSNIKIRLVDLQGVDLHVCS